QPVGVLSVPPEEDRHGDRVADLLELRLVPAEDEQALRPLAFGASSRLRPVDLREERDAVPLGDGLAESSRPGHLAQFWRKAVTHACGFRRYDRLGEEDRWALSKGSRAFAAV